ncbi:unnamed protein product [Brassica oleracea]|uniref:(rape) hypothetical protein n=1 Tax=Brassica napus TaxID=3708 RepID=A0A816RVM6_BRANA|nr:unnamed protein product [Brassica napus]
MSTVSIRKLSFEIKRAAVRDKEAKLEITPPHHHALGYPSSTTAPQPVSPPPVQHHFPEPPALTNALLPPTL